MGKTEFKKRVVSEMIGIYCRAKHKSRGDLCKDCKELEIYSNKKTDNCRNKNEKIICKNCSTQCYSKEMKKRIQEVMRFSGIRYFIRKPIAVIRYML